MDFTLTRTQIIEAAENYIGTKYVLHGRSPIFGLDCWGFFIRVCHDVGVGAPIISTKQYKYFLKQVITGLRAMQFQQISIPQAGDALIQVQSKLFAGHSGIMIEKNKMIQATNDGVQKTAIVGTWIGFEFPGVK